MQIKILFVCFLTGDGASRQRGRLTNGKLSSLSLLSLAPFVHWPNNSSAHQTVADHEAEIKSLQEQLTEATKDKEALQASKSSQSDQAADVRAAGDSSQAVQEELGRLRQEVLASSFSLVWGLVLEGLQSTAEALAQT